MYGHPFYFSLFSVVWPIVTLIWKIRNFLPYRFLVFPCSCLILTTMSTFSFFHCRDVDFVTTPRCFQAPRILCWGTGPPSSRLLFQFYFCSFFFFSDRPTQNQKMHLTINEKKRGMAYANSVVSCFQLKLQKFRNISMEGVSKVDDKNKNKTVKSDRNKKAQHKMADRVSVSKRYFCWFSFVEGDASSWP